VAPQKIENLLKLQPHISQAVVIGDQRNYCVALLTLDADAMAAWARETGVAAASTAALAADPAVRALLEREVAAVNAQLASFESVKRFLILPEEFTVEDGALTPSLKVKRKVVTERFEREIAALYA
jgi:long-chain acyl-CoA synthetase